MIRDEQSTLYTSAQSIEKLAPLQPNAVEREDDWDDDDSAESADDSDIQEMLRLLDQVWPRDHSDRDRTPRRFGRFLIECELGRGGFGVVYLAKDPFLNRRVALKLPRIGIVPGTESWRRFLREAQAASRLDHPNLIPLHEVGTIGPLGYIVSAYVAGPSLERWLRHKRRETSVRWGAHVVAALAHAMEHAHQRGILHRDLKPANVVLYAPECDGDSANGRAWEDGDVTSWVPRICDFGMAKLREADGDETRSRVACGSPSYMAPEQAEARQTEVGPKTDVYGLGAILYQILTGRPPFSGKNELETLRQVVDHEPAPLRTLRPGVPRDLETICLKCLAKKPGERYSSAAALADDLERFLDSRPITARPVAAWERGWRWARRHPASASLAVGVVVAVAAGLGGLLWHDTRLGEINEKLRLTVIEAEANAREALDQRTRVESHQNLLRRQLAGHQIFSAQQAVKARDFERALRTLDAAEPELGNPGDRGFAFSYLRQTIRERIEVLNGHGAGVNWVAAAPDGHSIASGDELGEVRLWDLHSSTSRRLSLKKPIGIQHFSLSPDGRDLAVVTHRFGESFLWDISSDRLRGKLVETESHMISSVLFSKDGRRLAAVGCEPAQSGLPFPCWDIRDEGDFPLVAPKDMSTTAVELTDIRLRSLIELLDDPSTAQSGSLDELKQSWVERAPRGIASARDQAFGLIAWGDGTFGVYLLPSRWRVAIGRIHARGTALVLFDDGILRERLLPRQRAQVERWAERLAPQSSVIPNPSNLIVRPEFPGSVAAFSPDGRRLAFWNEQGENGLKIIDLATGQVCAKFDLGPLNELCSMAFIADGATLAFGAKDQKVRLWHWGAVSDPVVLRGHNGKEAWSLAFSPDGKTLASAGDDELIRLWNLETSDEKAVLRGHHSLVTSVAFAPDGRTLASGSFDLKASVALWDVATGTMQAVLPGHTRRVRSVSFGRDGRTLASGSEDHSVIVWDVDRRQRQVTVSQKAHALCVVTSPDGRIVGSSDMNHIVLTDLVGGASRRIDTGASEIHSLVYASDGSHLISGHADGLIKTWDVATGRQTQALPGHSNYVFGLTLSPDGRALASAGDDRTVRVWDVSTGQELLCLTDCKARVNAVAFSPDGHTLAAADHTGAITLWRARPQN
jgi:eukaryotic-like serine/threonine-protein kinase